MAEASIKEISRQREEAVKELMSDLGSKSDALTEKGAYEKAISLYKDYRGKHAEITRMSRAAAAMRLSKEFERYRERMEEDKAVKRRKFDALMDKVVDALVGGGPEKALDVVEGASADTGLNQIGPRMDKLRKAIESACGVKDEIINSFAGSKGKKVTVNLRKGPRALTIVGVSGGRVSAMRQIGGARIKTTFGVDDLSMTEQLRLMGDDNRPEVALVKGLMALQSHALPHARQYFKKTYPMLGERLAAYIDTLEVSKTVPGNADDSGDLEGAVHRTEKIEREPLPPPKSRDAVMDSLLAANPGLRIGDISILQDSEGIDYKAVIWSRELRNIEPLADLTGLREIEFRSHGSEESRIDDISCLKDLRLEALDISNTSVRDLGPLENMPLKSLSIAGTRVFNIKPLSGMPLERFNAENSRLRRIDSLKGMPLKSLNISGTRIADLRPVKNLELRELYVRDTSVRSISWLKDMPLRILDLSHTKVYDFDDLKEMKLKYLGLGGTQVRDISMLEGVPLDHLDLRDTHVKDLAPLKGMNLKSLILSESPVRDLAPIEGMPIERLEIHNCRIDTLESLAGMPLKILDIGETPVESIGILSRMKLESLRINDTRITDLSPLQRMPLKRLDCRGIAADDLKPLMRLPVRHIFIDNPEKPEVMRLLSTMPELKTVNGRIWAGGLNQ